ncbi:MAG: PepSY domain-containing protein, partial [Verrucomicrobiaceae bacterium]
MPLRKIIFWVHLAAGLVAGLVIGAMSVTGIAIAFEEEILRWYDRKVSRVEVPTEKRLSVEELVRCIEAPSSGEPVSSIAMFSDPARAWQVHLGSDGPFYADPFTGGIRESRSHGVHEVLHLLEEWHRWLGAKEGLESGGRLVTGISNLALVFLCGTGLWLWFPRRWSWRAIRPLLLLKTSYKGKARDFN